LEPQQEAQDKSESLKEAESNPSASQETPDSAAAQQAEPAGIGSSGNMDLILDIPVTVSIELGRTHLIIEDILQLGQGSVVELEKLAGEPLEVLVQGRPIGKGEVVVVNEKFGIRLTYIISPAERIKRLG
jgi:flagellar motor switch protein FliN/FliY